MTMSRQKLSTPLQHLESPSSRWAEGSEDRIRSEQQKPGAN